MIEELHPKIQSEYNIGSLKETMRDIENPKWEETGRVHDWRNHVPSWFEEVWDKLGIETRYALYVVAKQEAGREEWD